MKNFNGDWNKLISLIAAMRTIEEVATVNLVYEECIESIWPACNDDDDAWYHTRTTIGTIIGFIHPAGHTL